MSSWRAAFAWRWRAAVRSPRSLATIRVLVIEPGAIATELSDRITHAASKKAADEATAEIGIPAQDIADVIAFAISRPQRVTLNEILVRPTAQAM